jgi:hypothetical protein
MKKLLTFLSIIIPLITCAQKQDVYRFTEYHNGIYISLGGIVIGDSTGAGSLIQRWDSLVLGPSDTAIYAGGHRIPLGLSAPTPATAFPDLDDTPGSYSGAGDYFVMVNSTPDGLVFINPATYAITNLSLETTLGGYTISDTKTNFNTALSDGIFIFASDTAAMLLTYIDRSDTAAMLVPYINRSDTAAMLANYALLSEAGDAYNSGSGITIDGSNNIDLGGALDASTTISGTATNNISIDMVDAGSHSARLDFQTGTGLSISGWNADNFTGDYGYLSVDNGGILFAQFDAAVEKSISLTSTSFIFRDDDGLQGPTFYADYRSNLTDLSIANWLTIKDTSFAQLGGQDLDATITSPGAGQDGGLVGWNNSTSKWEVKDVVPLDETDNVMLVADSTISFQNTSSSVVINLPIGAVVWDVQVYVETAFTGTGTDLLDVGITGTGEKFTADLDLSVADDIPVF